MRVLLQRGGPQSVGEGAGHRIGRSAKTSSTRLSRSGELRRMALPGFPLPFPNSGETGLPPGAGQNLGPTGGQRRAKPPFALSGLQAFILEDPFAGPGLR